MGWIKKTIDAGSAYRKPLADLSEDLFWTVGDKRAKLSKFWALLVLSSLIAAGGVISNSTPAVIGAMIVAPLATPIYGVALGAVVGSARGLRGSLLLLVSGIGVNIALGVLCGLVFLAHQPIATNPQITGRTAPTLLDLFVAVATGVAGSFALTRRDVSDILAGVAIAISLVPVLAVVGITLGAGEFQMALGALILFLTNVAAILVAGAVVFGAARYYQEAAATRDAEANAAVKRRANVFIVVLLVVLLAPLAVSSIRTIDEQKYVNEARVATEQWMQGTQLTLGSVRLEGNEIVVTVIGTGATPPVAELSKAVRTSVPAKVPVRLVEQSGSETRL